MSKNSGIFGRDPHVSISCVAGMRKSIGTQCFWHMKCFFTSTPRLVISALFIEQISQDGDIPKKCKVQAKVRSLCGKTRLGRPVTLSFIVPGHAAKPKGGGDCTQPSPPPTPPLLLFEIVVVVTVFLQGWNKIPEFLDRKLVFLQALPVL